MDEFSAEKNKRILESANIWLASVRSDGRPHLVPVWYVWIDGYFYICVEPSSVKARNIDSNKSVTVALEDGTKPIICEGSVQAQEQPWAEEVIEAFKQKYDWDIHEETQYTSLIKIIPRKWLSW